MERQQLFISGDKDKEAVAVILYRNGYTVRQTMAMPPKSNKKVKVLEFWKGEEK